MCGLFVAFLGGKSTFCVLGYCVFGSCQAEQQQRLDLRQAVDLATPEDAITENTKRRFTSQKSNKQATHSQDRANGEGATDSLKPLTRFNDHALVDAW